MAERKRGSQRKRGGPVRKSARTGRKTTRPGTRKKAAKKPAPRTSVPGGPGQRLDPAVRPGDVDLHVEVDPGKSGRFKGEVEHRLTLDRSRRRIVLNAADLRVSGARIEVDGRTRRGTLTPQPTRERIEVRFDEAIPAGEATLKLRFSGSLRGDLRGLYAASSGKRRYAFTQLEAADARRFFPCFDEPSMKARFAIRVTTSNRNTVLSNEPVTKVEPLGGGRKTVHFGRTPPLSTYLLAVGVGELEVSEPTRCGKTEIRVWHVPGKQHLTAFSLEAARETLSRLEKWFGLPYPYSKLDLVAVPDFEAGAMENAGAVFFRETLLLVDPETVTLQEQKRVAEVICHELAHMWYGNLVTMAWWNDLWLNEAFATWMAFQIVDAWKPEWKMWLDFQHHRSAALSMDALDHTHPIYTEVKSPSDATENFDLITYEKGASVVRMIERYLGGESFRAGVRQYMLRHRESNAEAADLWRALAEASGQDVESVVRAWIEQPGFPLLSVKRSQGKRGPMLSFSQRRFATAWRDRKSADADEKWPIPWVGRLGANGGRTRAQRALLTRARQQVRLDVRAPRFVYGNADEGGFFRPLHTPDELQALASERASLEPVERMGLLGHQWALVRAGIAPIETFLDLVAAFGDETDPDVLLTLRGPLAFLDDRVAGAEGSEIQEAFRARLVETFAPGWQAIGWGKSTKERTDRRLRRAALLSILGEIAEWEPVVAEAAKRGRRHLEDPRGIDPNLADAVVELAARGGDAAFFEKLRSGAGSADTPQERRRLLLALGSFHDPALVDRTLALVLTPAVGTQDVAILLTRLFGNPAARERAWGFLKKRWSTLRRRLPPMLVTRPIDATPALGTRAYRRDVAAFFRDNPVPTASRAVRQALERFDLDLAFVDAAGPRLRRWLARK